MYEVCGGPDNASKMVIWDGYDRLPTVAEIIFAVKKEFPETPFENIGFIAGNECIMMELKEE